jgi:hypothetical protein
MFAFGGKADVAKFDPQRLLLTQSGHWRLQFAAVQTDPEPVSPIAKG